MGKVLRGDFGESLRNKIPVSELLALQAPGDGRAGPVLDGHRARPRHPRRHHLRRAQGHAARRRPPTSSPSPGSRCRTSGWASCSSCSSRCSSAGCPPRATCRPGRIWGSNLTTHPDAVVRARHRAWPGVMMRHTRGAMLQCSAPTTCARRGPRACPSALVVLKHALRNALIPVITLGAIEFGRLLSGAVLTEQIFAIPGFGKLLVDGVFNRDYAVVQGVVLVSATLFVLLNLARRHPLLPRQSAAAGLTWPSAADRRRRSAPRLPPAPAAPARGRRRRRGRLFVVLALARRTWRPSTRWRPTSSPCASRPRRRLPPRHRRGRARRALAAHLGRPRLAPRRRHPRRPSRWSLSVPLGLFSGYVGRLDRRAHHAAHRRDAGHPLPHRGHRARRLPGPEPHQRHDRDRDRGPAHVPPARRAAPCSASRRRTTWSPRARWAARARASPCATCCPTWCRRS